jgi:hypothetical protein
MRGKMFSTKNTSPLKENDPAVRPSSSEGLIKQYEDIIRRFFYASNLYTSTVYYGHQGCNLNAFKSHVEQLEKAAEEEKEYQKVKKLVDRALEESRAKLEIAMEDARARSEEAKIKLEEEWRQKMATSST